MGGCRFQKRRWAKSSQLVLRRPFSSSESWDGLDDLCHGPLHSLLPQRVYDWGHVEATLFDFNPFRVENLLRPGLPGVMTLPRHFRDHSR